MATRDEKDSTRARANLLRHVLLFGAKGGDPLAAEVLRDVLDLCLSCKGCKAECPSNVDMARLKAEVQQHRWDACGVPWRVRLAAALPALVRAASVAPGAANALARGPAGRWLRGLAGFHRERSLPVLPPWTLRAWLRGHVPHPAAGRRGRVWLLADEFTDALDAPIGAKVVELLERLGYAVDPAPVRDTGRALLSKGLLHRAARLAARNVRALRGLVTPERPLLGIEPSAVLSFRDEYPGLARGAGAADARELAASCLMADEFLVRELEAGRLAPGGFGRLDPERTVWLHGHCHQKAIVSIEPTVRVLECVEGARVRVIPSGCCGMAGAFGYEREHYALSMKVGELVLFPAVRGAAAGDLVAAPGTSCRHQIFDGTGRRAVHPLEIVRDALGA
jgi:Fe-S oxidoreductase